MESSSWLVQIYELSDTLSQDLLVALLSAVEDLTVHAETTSADTFLIVDCVDSSQAQAVFRLVTSVDFGATLVHTTNGPAPKFSSVA